MSESDLDNLLNDLDIGDAEGGEGGDASLADDLAAADAGEDTAAADAGESGAEEIDLGDVGDVGGGESGAEEIDLGDIGDIGGGEGEGEGEGVELDADLQATLDASGEGEGEGEGMQISDDLADSLTDALAGGEEGGAEAESVLGALAASAGSAGGGEGAMEEAVPDFSAAGLVGVDEDSVNIEFLLDIKLHVTFEVGRAKMLISDLLTLGQGSVIELHRLVGDELDLLINGKLVAKGEVVVVNEKFGCRITSIVPPEDRIKHLAGV